MATLEPGAALATVETALRSLMAAVYAEAYGPAWLEKVAPGKVQEWAARAEVERKARGSKGVMTVPSSGLSYANYFDLLTISDKYWEPLSGALGKKSSAMALLKRLDNIRNAVGHSRPLLPFERDLLSGIAGQIRNQVTMYMSTQDEAGDIYPRIESVTDHFGRRIESTKADSEIAGGIAGAPYPIVRPGDEVRFECHGIDPQGRDVEWALHALRRGGIAGVNIAEARGSSVELTWSVTEDEVSESHAVNIYLSVAEGRYHRAGHFDHRVYFMFRVRPPEQ